MQIGESAPAFSLPSTDGKTWSLDSFAGSKALVVVQMCNHCPYVVAYQDRLNDAARKYAARGVAFVGINSNDAEKYPSDSLEAMQTRVREAGIPFPYLHDESQATARALGAERTPELFVFDAERKLVYHGRLDDNHDNPDAVTQCYLCDALDAVLAGQAVPLAETPAVGCTVKWK
ncbi:MAG: thioredoxin family protein [Armatimonadetes bacterium]|nr:thioredoxin family protein [Armatimonadota bacterium]